MLKRQALGCVITRSGCRDEFTRPKAHLFIIPVGGRDHGCQIAIARFLGRMCLAFQASGLWLRYATLQIVIPSFPWIAPLVLHPVAIQGEEGIKFCHLATLAREGRSSSVCCAGAAPSGATRTPLRQKSWRWRMNMRALRNRCP